MANLIKNGEGTTLTDWSATNTTLNNGFKIVKGKMLQSMILTPETKTSKYKLSYTCTELRSAKSYFLLTVGLSAGAYNTYFMPIQFTGLVEIIFDMNMDALNIAFEVVGDLTISSIVLDPYSDLTTKDKEALDLVTTNGPSWNRIIDVTSSTGKLNADMLEGLINTTLNRFANASGTIVQENGEIIFYNGNTPENSTAVMKMASAGILIADTKNALGEWIWATAVTGAGISASAIVTGVLSAITISGVDITASSMTGGSIVGVTIEGSVIYAGDRAGGIYTEIDSAGRITGYYQGKKTFMLTHSQEGHLSLGSDLTSFDGDSISFSPYGTIGTADTTYEGAAISTGSRPLIIYEDVIIGGKLTVLNG